MLLEQMIYLDNSATTKPCPEAVEACRHALTDCWGNPSSLHLLGMDAELCVTKAREAVAKLLHAKPEEIYFNGCGTEGNNTAILGAAKQGKKRGNRVVTTAIEHPSVLETVARLEEDGFEVIRLKPEQNGIVPISAFRGAIHEKTVLVSVMLVNNEIGSIQPLNEIAEIIKEKKAPALLHCDGVQAFGKLPIDLNKTPIDILTASGHKIHGPKGVGVLYLRKGVHLPPLLTGGGQEKGLRSGTESVPLISALGAAVEALPNLNKQLEKMQELWHFAVKTLRGTGVVEINSDEAALPYILNISVPGYRSETLLHFLENEHIYVSSGSACAKGGGSYVLRECGYQRSRIDSALRLSFSRYTTREEIECLAAALVRATNKLRKASV